MQREPGITSGDIVLALTTISFDPAVLDIFLPLSVGARIVVVPEETRYDPDKLLDLLHRSGATILQATPTTWQLLMRSEWTRKELRALIGGEMLTPDLAREILRRCGQLWNLYGPTETTVWSTVGRIEDPDDITIGRTIPNQRAYIVDRHNQMAAIGVPGELLMGGAGVGRYYVAQPELTAEKFVPNPFSSNAGNRVYRTGDLCRYRADGRIEFLGRIDHQVKIRGFRVEPGEIEALLAQHQSVRQCVVVDRGKESGERRLIGYFVPVDPSSPPDDAGLREFLKRKLPDYMVPAAFVVLERLPLTRTGKIDRSALPAPTPIIRTSSNRGEAPRNETERQVLRIWEEVLQMKGVGLTDDFFQIGGHSLMAVRLMAEVNSTCGLQLPLATIFRNPTVESLAAAITAGDEVHKKPPGLIFPREGETGQRIFWMPSVGSVERFVECHHLARFLQGDYRFFGFDPTPNITDISALADHCLKLIRSEQSTGPYFLAGYCQCGHVAYEIATRLERDGHEIALLAIIDSSARDFAPDLRQRLRWVRDGFRGNPHSVLRRMRSIVRRKLRHRGGSDGNETNNGAPTNRFVPHLRAANRHRVRRFSGTIDLIRSDEWLANLPHSPKLGWDALSRSVRLHPVKCKHLSVLTDKDSLGIIADVMKEALKSCQPV
jgi:thioesterase domain-containing protein